MDKITETVILKTTSIVRQYRNNTLCGSASCFFVKQMKTNNT